MRQLVPVASGRDERIKLPAATPPNYQQRNDDSVSAIRRQPVMKDLGGRIAEAVFAACHWPCAENASRLCRKGVAPSIQPIRFQAVRSFADQTALQAAMSRRPTILRCNQKPGPALSW